MTGGERYLEQQAKRARREYLEVAQRSPRPPPFDPSKLSLRDAPSRFRQRLHDILHPCAASTDAAAPPPVPSLDASHLHEVVFSRSDLAPDPPRLRDLDVLGGGRAATIVGSSQVGKTSLLNSLLNLFGFFPPAAAGASAPLAFPTVNLLPSEFQDGTGLPFPVRLEYGPTYQLLLQHWDSSELLDVMSNVADRILSCEPDYFEDLRQGFQEPRTDSFTEFIVRHSTYDDERGFVPTHSAVESLQADGHTDYKNDFLLGNASPSTDDIHQAVSNFLISLVDEGRWFRYKHVTIKCPSQLLKHLHTGSEALSCSDGYCILDLPATGLGGDDNNFFVEELVLRDVKEAATIIILTGERNFTQDIIQILKSSVFELLLDPMISPRPTIAMTNSRKLRGLKEKEMDDWRLCATSGWNIELQAFAKEIFSTRHHRQLASLELDLFPNDLEGFLESKTGEQEKGVSMLAGYFLRLPQETLMAGVIDVLEQARSVIKMLDQLWQAEKVSWTGGRLSRLRKEVKMLRDEEFSKDLEAEFNPTAQRKIFGFEMVGPLNTQVDYIRELFNVQKQRLSQRLENVKNSSNDLKQDISKLVKDALIHIASQWDKDVGEPAFYRFLAHGEKMCHLLYQKWARKVFHNAGRDRVDSENQEQACKFMVKYLTETARAAIKKGIMYTLTNGLRSQAWNLDSKELTKGIGGRRGRSASAACHQVHLTLMELMKNKEAYFREYMLEHMSLQSQPIQELVRLMKYIIKSNFEECEKNFAMVTDALEKIATGKLALIENPVVILRQELDIFVRSGERYLARHRELRDSFGAQELKKMLRLQSRS